jgi:hypothetical protein
MKQLTNVLLFYTIAITGITYCGNTPSSASQKDIHSDDAPGYGVYIFRTDNPNYNVNDDTDTVYVSKFAHPNKFALLADLDDSCEPAKANTVTRILRRHVKLAMANDRELNRLLCGSDIRRGARVIIASDNILGVVDASKTYGQRDALAYKFVEQAHKKFIEFIKDSDIIKGSDNE